MVARASSPPDPTTSGAIRPEPDPPVRRGARARERVLAAALDQLGTHGIAGFSVEAVARRAGASKTTVYRHWSSIEDLLVEAMDRTFAPFPAPRTGRFEDDLVELLTRQSSMLSDPTFTRLMAAFIDAAEHHPTLARRHEQLTRRRREPLLDVLTRAHRAGELDPSADLELLADLLVGPMFYNRFLAHRPIPASLPRAIVHRVLRGSRPAPEPP